MEFKRFEYKVENSVYYVYVINNGDYYEYWLQNKDYGIMSLIFGLKDYDLSIVEEQLLEHIQQYKEEYEDEE